MKCLVTRLDMVLELGKFVAMVMVHGGESGGDIVIIEFHSRGRLNQLKRSSYDRVMAKTVNRFDTYKRGLIQDIPTSLPLQPIGEATKAFNLRRIPPRVQGRSHFTYFLYLIVKIRILYRDHLNPNPPSDAKTNPYLQAPLSPIYPEITKILSKHTRDNEVIKEQEQSDQGLAQIDQLRRKEHEVSECKMVNTLKNDAHQKEARQIGRISNLLEKPNPRSLTIPCPDDIFNINAIADLGASVNIMPESHLEELSLANPKDANIIVEIADKTSEHLNERPTAQETQTDIYDTDLNESCKQDNQSQDELSYGAYSTNSKTHWCEPVRQEHKTGYTLWASCDPYHETCDGGGLSGEKMKHYWKSTNDYDRKDLEWEGLSYANWVRARYGKVNNITKERILQIFWDNNLGGKTREKTLTEEHEDPEKCRETKTRAIIRAMINKLPEEWFLGVSKDMDDLEGIIDYLEPTLYEGFIDHNDEAYKRRRNKLLGMPYTVALPIIKEEAEITRYNQGAGEVFTKTKILNIKEFARTTPNIADIRAEIINNKNASSEDLSNTKKRHWCKPIYSERKTYAPDGLHVTPISTNVLGEITLGKTRNIRKVATIIYEQL
ncbi:hypothetical protein Tco_1044231 [Tanacetum coccineum]|uniref:Uncharacterized protein n=1 Tax=Tanacetum coccineum TaxID=301880 RepID=A0ABQ5GPC4_9ASTR